MFEPVPKMPSFPEMETRILEFWERTHAFERLREKNRGRQRWSFLDGPITANGPMGVHHTWGRTYKDVYQRYFAMTGHELRYQNGFDCQGLWVEVEVEKELGLGSKRDIESLVPGDRFASIERFVSLCKQRVDRFARLQTEQSIRLGYWMDWDRDEDWRKPPDERRSYFTMSDANNYAIWGFLKKCHERGFVYRGADVMPWCPRCSVGLSQMEMHEGYRLVEHRAVFVRFPLRNRPGESLLIWTTTPWTLPANVAAAVNPELTYLRVQHREHVLYLAKGAFSAPRLEDAFQRKQWIDGVPKLKSIAQILKEKGGYEVLGELRGADMLAWSYSGPFDELSAANTDHRVVAWDAVGETEGSGIVHVAPGCGREDFQLGRTLGLATVAPLDECGVFLPGFGELSGKRALEAETTDWILASLREKRLLLATERYPHSYPHCWRCKTELLFRLVEEWFISMSWREEIIRACREARWIPEFGLERELDWLRNMGDWMISKKRYWGLALPIWVCRECGAFDVVSGKEELRSRASSGFGEFEGHSPHRPWIDVVKIRCASCRGEADRIPDVGNPWLDAGIVPFSTLSYGGDRKSWEQWFPADLVTESFPGQFRNWFYALLAMSTMMEGRAPFKVLLGHALVTDERGEEMHKTKGNAIPFDAAAEKIGADVMRWMFCRQNPAATVNFGYGAADEVRRRFVLKLWNSYALFCNYARLDGFDPAAPEIPVAERPELDRWILADLQSLVKTARLEIERFNVMAFCLAAEEFVDRRLSNWYIRRSRRRFWRSERTADKQAAYQTLHTVLVTISRLLAPMLPFLSESMYQNLCASVPGHEPSVHLTGFPEPDEALVDPELSADMDAALRLVSLGAAARNAAKIKVRQPLAEMRVRARSDRQRAAARRFQVEILDELNVKRLVLEEEPAHSGDRSVPQDAFVHVTEGDTEVLLDVRLSDELRSEGIAREVVRRVQEQRRQAELEVDDRIFLRFSTESPRVNAAIDGNRAHIFAETLAVDWAPLTASSDKVHRVSVEIDGESVTIELRFKRAGAPSSLP